MIFGFAELEAGFVGNAINGFARKTNVGIDAGADGSAAEGKLAEIGLDFPEPVYAVFHLAGVTAEFLPKTDGRGILQMGAANFENIAKNLGLGEQRGVKFIQRGNQVVNDA